VVLSVVETEPPGLLLSLEVVVDDSEVFSEVCGATAGAPGAPGAPGGPGSPATGTGTVVVVSFSHPMTAVAARNAKPINAAAVPVCFLFIILPSWNCGLLS
jgi:hypothetical protein